MDETIPEPLDDLTVVRTVSLTNAIEKQIERLIVDGALAPGERLNEIQLASRFGTSRGPLREAMRSLAAKGFVRMIRNRGVFVRELSIEEVLEVYDVRAALFGLAGRLLAQKMDDELLARLNSFLERMEIAAGGADFERYYPLNLEFHQLIVKSAGNDTLLAEYQRFVKKMHLFRAKSLVQGGGLAVSNREHREMVDALASGDIERAHATHWRHVERAKARLRAAMDVAPASN
jgi:DNA-binding GntR family transcriptional regulator